MAVKAYIVDDEPAVGRLLQSMLAGAGIDSIAETDSSRAAVQIQTQRFDIVFLDIHMPGMDGLELARIQRAHGANTRTPIVMMTGDETADVFGEAHRAGITCFLYKPFSMLSIKRTLYVLKNSIWTETHDSVANRSRSLM